MRRVVMRLVGWRGGLVLAALGLVALVVAGWVPFAAGGGSRCRPAVVTGRPTARTPLSAVLHGVVTDCGVTGTRAWFVIRFPAGRSSRVRSPAMSVAGSRGSERVSFELNGLVPRESVAVRFEARVGRRVIRGRAVTFTTPAKRAGHPPSGGAPPLRFMYSDSAASAAYGFNLMDVSSKEEADGTPAGTRGMIWIGNYDNSSCQFEVSDRQVQTELAGAAGDRKIAGYALADEPDLNACPNAPQQIAARSRLVHQIDTDPSHFTYMVMDSNSGSISLKQVSLWKGVTDYVGLDPYPCHDNQACDFSWIDQIISAANRAGLSYWGVVQAFNDAGWRWPTASEMTHMLNQWARSNEKGYAVFAWTWNGENLSSQPTLLRVLKQFNATARSGTARRLA